MKTLLIRSLLAFSLLTSCPITHAGFDEGLAAYKKRNFATALKEWRPAIQARQAAARRPGGGETSALGELTASFTIERGVARSTDLKAQGGPFAIAGGGSVDLAGRRLDLLSRVSLLVPPAGTDAALLAGLRGVARIAVGREPLLWAWTHRLTEWLRLGVWSWLGR